MYFEEVPNVLLNAKRSGDEEYYIELKSKINYKYICYEDLKSQSFLIMYNKSILYCANTYKEALTELQKYIERCINKLHEECYDIHSYEIEQNHKIYGYVYTYSHRGIIYEHRYYIESVISI